MQDTMAHRARIGSCHEWNPPACRTGVVSGEHKAARECRQRRVSVAPQQHQDEGIAILGYSRVECTYLIECLNQAVYELVEVCLPRTPSHPMACPRAAPGFLGNAPARGTLARHGSLQQLLVLMRPIAGLMRPIAGLMRPIAGPCVSQRRQRRRRRRQRAARRPAWQVRAGPGTSSAEW